MAAVAWPGSSVRFTGKPAEPKRCVAAPGCAIQYENAAALTNRRIARVSALLRSHAARVVVPERGEVAERLARFSTCRPWPAAKSVQRCADSGMCMEAVMSDW